ncbi:SLC13 family permease [Halalkalicoccus sp. NIPERK01]|uniref:SLC13 family permease n=1 Tax=Halalkalicoccus sp. NIPERK01 TaxID=3053469 RepID=UPI00256F4773|nr:SLC13 family permease [Halalkalicoccus sp. NIPERK01]MDL5362689.1 SLC13 family permease [Halalkalicoccus sp. NIPERK01]
MLVVFGIVLLALALFITAPVPIDVTAIAVMVALIVLEPWTGIGPADGVSGFASSATITVLMMFVLSEGIRKTGLVQIVSARISAFAGDDERKLLGSIIGVSGLSSGFINNTPVVAIMIPMASDLARRVTVSPSRFMIPLSFASMMGGMLTLIGTSTNILASDVSARLIGRPFSMFEFTSLGALVLVVGSLYLLVAAPRLLPDRLPAEGELTEEFEMADYLTEVVVREDSPFVGRTVREAIEGEEFEFDLVQLVRDGEVFGEPLAQKTIRPGDVLVVRTGRDTVVDIIDVEGVDLLPHVAFTDADLAADGADRTERGTEQDLVEVMIPPDSSLVGETLSSANFRDRYDATVLALRRGPTVLHRRMDHVELRGGDTLLVQASRGSIERLGANRDFVVGSEVARAEYRRSKLPIALAIVAAVVAVAALDLYPILVTSMAGAVAMVATGVLRPTELYDAIDWSVIFMLAGLIPLGMAMERTGAAAFLAGHVVANTTAFDAVVVLGVFYLFTALITNVVSNNASVVLMIPVAVDAANRIGANEFSFVLAVTFAASSAMLTPIGYQTNLMVYAPGGYRFADFARVGAPLQLILAVVTTLGIALIWGV